MSYMPKSKSDTHLTPQEVFDTIQELDWIPNMKYFDPCPANAEFDGLRLSWASWNYVNPPYGDGTKDENGNTLLARFVKKALDEYANCNYTIMLLPSKTDQNWFHWLLEKKFDIYWFNHRLRFTNNKYGATQPHFLVRIAP